MDLLKNFPKEWYVELHGFNEEELKLASEFRKKINANPSYNGSDLFSYHVLTNLTNDGSFFEYACSFNFIEQRKRSPNAVKLTKQRFFKLISIMDLLKNFPKEWYVEVGDFNPYELVRASVFRDKINTNEVYVSQKLSNGHVITNLLNDGSFFESHYSFVDKCRAEKHPNAVKLTKEQFLELISETPKTMIDKNKTINIGYDLLKEYYEASTEKQREHINKHFTIDGTTTIGAIIELHDMACKGWKEKIKANHPECFEDDKYFDLSKVYAAFSHNGDTPNVLKTIGLQPYTGIIRSDGEYKNKGIVLDSSIVKAANWEIVDDGNFIIAVPTKIKK